MAARRTIGFAWTISDATPDVEPFRRAVKDAAEIGAGWVVLRTTAAPVTNVRAIVSICNSVGLLPVLHIVDGLTSPSALHTWLGEWVEAGVRHVVLDDAPNRVSRWSVWQPHGLPARYARWIAPFLEVVASFDEVVPILPPMSGAGDYRGLVFLGEMLAELRRLDPLWLDRLGVAAHNDLNGHSINWGKGGSQRWGIGAARQPGKEDENGFYGWEWTRQSAEEVLHRPVEVFAVRTALPPEASAAQQCEDVSAIQSALQKAEVPPTIGATFELFGEEGWFGENGAVRRTDLTRTLQSVAPLKENQNQRLPEMVRVLHTDGRVETMVLEEYLRGVLPAEMGAGAPLEALKAQAVAARCYAGRAAISPRHSHAGADVCTTTHCQVWRAQTYPRTDQAVKETGGIVGYVESRLIDAVYFACCDGKTKNSEDVWRSKVSYLRSVSCVLKGQDQYGHGVGMCQRGAMQMAKQGAGYADILRHYYTGVSVELAPRNTGDPQPIPTPTPTPTPQPTPSPHPIPAPAPAIRVERRAGVRAVAGNLRHSGITVIVADPWGNRYETRSGNKPEIGPNGWEIPVPVDAVYRVTWQGGSISVPVRGDFVVIYE